MSEEITIRTAVREDMVFVAEMIQELADFEKMPDGPKISAKELIRDGFDSSPPGFKCMVGVIAGNVVGYALYFPTYSTWEGRALMLEDLYVRPERRRSGLGGRLFGAVAKEAWDSGCSRLDFHVLAWNEARAFYERRGALDLTTAEDWRYYRLAGDRLRELALSTS